MRVWLCALLCVLGVACAGPTDAERYTTALDPATSFDDAVAACVGMASAAAAGDCHVAVLEAHQRLEASDCDQVQAGTWRDECTFLLAERQWAAGQHDIALETCLSTRFARRCSWHLVQDEVEATLDLAPPQAEARLDRFRDARRIPDAAVQFWRIRLRERAAAGHAVGDADCAGLGEPDTCVRALEAHVGELLDAVAKADLERVCAAEPGTRVTRKGKPSWSRGAIVDAAEARWVARRCAADAQSPAPNSR